MSEYFSLSLEESPDIERIDATAVAIAALLAQEPATKPVITEQLVTELWSGVGIAAYDGHGEPAGYVTARLTGLLGEAMVVPGNEPLTEKRVPHIRIGSLVVAPSCRGRGLGSVLVNTVLIAARSSWYNLWHELCIEDRPAGIALASAVAASQGSQQLFEDLGFWPTDSVEIAAAHGYGDSSPLPVTKQLMNRIVVL